MGKVNGMAEEVKPTITPEQVERAFQINAMLDAMVMKVTELITGAMAALPTGPSKIAFMNKMLVAMSDLDEAVRKELANDPG